MSSTNFIQKCFDPKDKTICWYPLQGDLVDRLTGNVASTAVYTDIHFSGALNIKSLGGGNGGYMLVLPAADINKMKGVDDLTDTRSLISDYYFYSDNNAPSGGGDTQFICNALAHQWIQTYFTGFRISAPNYGIYAPGVFMFNTNTWIRVTVLWGKTVGKIYVDKVLKASTPGNFGFRNDFSSLGFMRYAAAVTYISNLKIINSENLGDIP